MTRRLTTWLATAAALAPIAAASASAQDVVVMRRSLGVPKRGAQTPAPTPTPAVWRMGDWTFDDANTCTAAAPQTRRAACQRNGVGVPDAQCADARPEDERRTVERYGGCAVDWAVGAAGPWTSPTTGTPVTCGDAVRTRSVQCARTVPGLDPQPLADAECSARGPRPWPTEMALRTETCGYRWQQAWTSESTCSAATSQTAINTCLRSDRSREDAPEESVDGAQCATALGETPATTRVAADVSGCQHQWRLSTAGAWRDACRIAANRDEVHQCLRSDGVAADPSQCIGADPSGIVAKPYGGCAVTNADFEAGGVWYLHGGTSESGTATQVRDASNGHARMTWRRGPAGVGGLIWYRQNFTCPAGDYTVSFRYRTDRNLSRARFIFRDYSATNRATPYMVPQTREWQNGTATFNNARDGRCSAILVASAHPNFTGDELNIDYDDVVVRGPAQQ